MHDSKRIIYEIEWILHSMKFFLNCLQSLVLSRSFISFEHFSCSSSFSVSATNRHEYLMAATFSQCESNWTFRFVCKTTRKIQVQNRLVNFRSFLFSSENRLSRNARSIYRFVSNWNQLNCTNVKFKFPGK